MPAKAPTQPKTVERPSTHAMATRASKRKQAPIPEPSLAIPLKRIKRDNKPTAPAPGRKAPTKKASRAKASATAAPAHPANDEDAEPPKMQVEEPVPLHTVTAIPSNPINALPTPPLQGRPGAILFAWGAGNFGQFGMGPDCTGQLDKPRKNKWTEEGVSNGLFGSSGSGIESVAAGGLHTMFADEKGRIWTCGVNDEAALGRPVRNVPNPDEPGKFLDPYLVAAYPHLIRGLEAEGFRAVRLAAGDNISAAISDTGSLRVWGTFKSREGSLGFSAVDKYQWEPIAVIPNQDPNKPEPCVQVACGENHILVLTAAGDVYAWGDGGQGRLGREILKEAEIDGLTPERVLIGSRDRLFKVIGAGFYTSYAVDSDGRVWAWGLDNKGQSGTKKHYAGARSIILAPKEVEELAPAKLEGETIVQIVGGEHHALFRTSGGRVFSCGRANGGQLGLPESHPAMAARKEELDGGVVDAILTPSEITFPVDSNTDPIVHIEVGARTNLAISRDGALYSWGEGNQGELGIGEGESNATTPREVVRRVGGSWRAVGAACGGQHCIGLFQKRE